MCTDDAEQTDEDVAAERVGDHILGLHVEHVLTGPMHLSSSAL